MNSETSAQSSNSDLSGESHNPANAGSSTGVSIDTKTIVGAEAITSSDMEVSVSPIGGTIGKYEIRSQLGAGGMGAVYLAFDTLIEREVAIKVLSQEVANSTVALQRFLQEARSIGRLNNPNVVSIYEIDRWNGQYYLVMELLSGGSLAELVEKRGPLPWQEACQLIAQAASGLAAAHSAGMVHRDIKPENLMLTKEGLVKVVDFGLSKLVDAANDTRTAVTKQGQILGTPQYMSPEQFESTEVDSRTDIYSLGASLYRLLTARFPFQDCASIVQTMMAHLNKPAPKPTEIDSRIPKECDRIITRAMSKRPADRYQHASEMAADLTALLQSQNGIVRDSREAEAATRVISDKPKFESLTIADEVKPLRSVAIIEPSKMLAAMMRDAVVRAGASRIDVLSSKEEALTTIGRRVPDLLITAMQLSDGRGLDLISALCQQSSLSRTCVVLNSSDSTVEDLIGAGSAASQILAPKKVRPDDVLRVVHAAGPCEIAQGPVANALDPLSLRLVVMTDLDKTPEKLADLIRQVGLLDVSVIGLGDAALIPKDDVPTVVLRLSPIPTKASTVVLQDTKNSIFSHAGRHLLAEISLDSKAMYLSAVYRQGVTASVHRILDAKRLTCLLQACRAA